MDRGPWITFMWRYIFYEFTSGSQLQGHPMGR